MGRITRNNNVSNLKTQYKNLSGVKHFQVYSLIDLYARGNIFNINTLRYEINKILSSSSIQQQKQIDNYVNIIKKFLEPRKPRQKKQNEKIKELVANIEKKLKPKEKIKTYLVDALLFTTEGNVEKRPDFKKIWQIILEIISEIYTVHNHDSYRISIRSY